jgi:hypothetical protein
MEVLLRAQCWQSRRQLLVSLAIFFFFFPHKSSRDQLFGGQCARVGDTVQGLENSLHVIYWHIASPCCDEEEAESGGRNKELVTMSAEYSLVSKLLC